MDRYSELKRVLDMALEQARGGKGKERHAAEGQNFEEQKIVWINKMIGSNHGNLFQAAKKVIESARLEPQAAIRELLGAINYIAAGILILEEATRKEVTEDYKQKVIEPANTLVVESTKVGRILAI